MSLRRCAFVVAISLLVLPRATAADSLTATTPRDAWQRAELQRLLDDAAEQAAAATTPISLQELLIMTAVLCRRFRVVMAEDNFDADDVIAGVSVYPRHGIQMRIERRTIAKRQAA